MNELRFGLEVFAVGFGVVMVTLILLAFILVCFSKFLAPRKKEIIEPDRQPQQTAADGKQSSIGADDTTVASAKDQEEQQEQDDQEEQEKDTALEGETMVQPELVAAIAGAIYVEETKQARPEVIAAIAGAVHYVLDVPGSPEDDRVKLQPADDLWAQYGRTRLMQLRQEFVLLRRGILR